jgi:SIR2-like domain
LKAFETQNVGEGWLVNHVHEWAAKCLMDGSAAAVVTTNFDDCIEKALLNAQANTYQLTGDPYIDGDGIVNGLANSASGRLIVIVSGPEACLFAQTLLPQLGQAVSLLFKLHGSCYAPETCIDTRLQRQQGLPSYAVDILDNLLTRTVFFVAGFSGGDLNDNTDYLRMIHNKRHGRLVWLQKNPNILEPGVRALQESLETGPDSDHGLCFLTGAIQGGQIDWNEEPSKFRNDVLNWSNSLGASWCKLTVLDLIELCDGTQSQASELHKLGFSGGLHQDWNIIVEGDLPDLIDQEQV